MFGDLGIDQFASDRLQRSEGAFLVGAHPPGITGDIGGEDRRQPPLDSLSAQCLLPGRLPISQSAPPMEDDQPDATVRIINRGGGRSGDFGLIESVRGGFGDGFDTCHARDVLGTRCGTSAVLAGLVSAKTRAWTTLRRH